MDKLNEGYVGTIAEAIAYGETPGTSEFLLAWRIFHAINDRVASDE